MAILSLTQGWSNWYFLFIKQSSETVLIIDHTWTKPAISVRPIGYIWIQYKRQGSSLHRKIRQKSGKGWKSLQEADRGWQSFQRHPAEFSGQHRRQCIHQVSKHYQIMPFYIVFLFDYDMLIALLTIPGLIQPSEKRHGLHSPQDWISDLEILFPQTQRERWPGESIRLHVPSKYNLGGL